MTLLLKGVGAPNPLENGAKDRITDALRSAGANDVLPVRLGGADALLVTGLAQSDCAGVDEVDGEIEIIDVPGSFPLVDRRSKLDETVVDVGGIDVGGKGFTVIAGPCAVETQEIVEQTAWTVRSEGASILRGGAYKPRTSPYAFQGMGLEGLRILAEARAKTGLSIVSEVVDARDVELMTEHVDMLQVGARNAQNFALLTEIGRSGLPVLLKRGFGCTIDEWLCAAEYIVVEGNENVVLCERGIRTFEPSLRFTLDIAAVAAVKQRSHLPVVVDPSHSTGDPELVAPMTLAALAAGADGVIVDVHPDPAAAKCDGAQALLPSQFSELMAQLRPITSALGRNVSAPALPRSA